MGGESQPDEPGSKGVRIYAVSASFQGSGNHYERWISFFMKKDPGTAFKEGKGLVWVFLQDAEIEVLISLIKSLFHSGAGDKEDPEKESIF